MPTFTAFTTLMGRPKAEQLGEVLERLTPEPTGIGVFEVEDGSGMWEVGGYFTESPDRGGLALLAAAFGARPFTISELPETDWVAHVQRNLTPVEAGRFFVYGSHDADKVPVGSVPLLIEAAMAFGTGHHGTTLGCLRALDRLVDEGHVAGNVADIGCGTAVLAMAAARMYSGSIIASDIDEVAVEVARANIKANGLQNRVECVEAIGLDHPQLAAAAPYDLIFANILKGPLIELAPAISSASKSGGFVVLSGILNTQADEIISVYAKYGYNTHNHEEIVDWSILILAKNR